MAEIVLLESPASSSSPSPSPSPSAVGDRSRESSPLPVVVAKLKSPCRSRRVTFQVGRTEKYIESLASLSEADRKFLWYSDEDIEACKGRARELSEGIKKGRIQEDNTRGLELRLSPERQRRKYMIIHAILRAQKRYTDPKQLSNIARKCTVWSKTVAAIVAQHDYCSLYHPERIASIANLPSLEKYPLPFKSKDPLPSVLNIKRPRSPAPQNHRVRPRPPQCAMSC